MPPQTEAPRLPRQEPPLRAQQGAPTASERPGDFARVPFSSCTLEEKSTRSKFFVSSGFHLLGMIALAALPVAVREVALNTTSRIIVFNQPQPPPVTEPLPQRPAPRMITPRRKIELPPPRPEERTVLLPKPPEPKPLPLKPLEPPRAEPTPVVPQPVRVVRQALVEQAPVTVQAVKPKVRTDVFAVPDGPPPTTSLPPKSVQTGGFGDPDGTHRDTHSNRPGNPTEIGSFDLPAGPGQGNGTGGASGVRGSVASAGFGNGIASNGDASRGARKGAVRAGGFGDGRAEPEPARPRARPIESPIVPIEILSKPRPVYTEEARLLRLEGEVVLEVLFSASGNLRVLRVVRGMGHGLDEAAIKAAEMIRFKPARRDNQPVDYTATVRMVFQLAY